MVFAGTASTTFTGNTVGTVIVNSASGGASPYTYQWYRSLTPLFIAGAGNIVAGATSLTLNDTGLTNGVTYYYKNVVTDSLSQKATSNQTVICPITPASFLTSPTAGLRTNAPGVGFNTGIDGGYYSGIREIMPGTVTADIFAPGQLPAGGGTVTAVSVASANGLAGSVATPTTTPAISLSTTVTGVLKGNGTAISQATAGTDYQAPISLTTTGSSGAATFSGNTLNVPVYAAGTGSVTSVSVVNANGLSGTVANPTTTPAITLATTITGLLKGNSTAISAASAGTDYQAPISLTTTGTSGAATFSGNTLNVPNYANSGGTVTAVSVVSVNGLAGTVANPTTTPAISLSTTITGLLKGNGTAISAGTAGTDYQAPISLTTTGTSGAATFSGNTLNVPNYANSGGTVTTVSVASANGFTGTVATATTTPVITVATSVTGIVKGNGTALSAATAGTDYQAPITLTTTGTTGAATFISNTLNVPQYAGGAASVPFGDPTNWNPLPTTGTLAGGVYRTSGNWTQTGAITFNSSAYLYFGGTVTFNAAVTVTAGADWNQGGLGAGAAVALAGQNGIGPAPGAGCIGGGASGGGGAGGGFGGAGGMGGYISGVAGTPLSMGGPAQSAQGSPFMGSGGGGGSSGTLGTAGNGGNGGGIIYIEATGNVSFSGMTLSCIGAAGTAGSAGTSGGGGGSGGGIDVRTKGNVTFTSTTFTVAGGAGAVNAGGGAGGIINIMYLGATTGTLTTVVTGGAAGSGSSTTAGTSGQANTSLTFIGPRMLT